ncbi:MAG TPA: zinc-ribbon domain-containing protein [Planctomycetota bacterium]
MRSRGIVAGMARRRQRETFECPNCGASVPVGAKACRECGSDAATGWQDQEEIDYQGEYIPEGYSEDPDHPGDLSAAPRRVWVALVAILTALALLALTVL